MCSPLKRGKEWKVAALILAAVAMGVPRTASADQCIPDDLIVDGSINCGFDSVCNRNFGFDTLVLSENNLRVFFEDTSTSASFPTNDWRILINDTTNGGNNFFAVEDTTAGNRPFTIRAGAGSNALFVDNGGEVGLGTSVPVVNLHIVDGNTPTVRLDQNGSSGFTPQVWDLAGNETNFFIRDVSNGSKLPFRIRPNAPTSSIDVKGGSGNVGFGSTNPDQAVHVLRNDNSNNVFVKVQNSGSAGGGVRMTNPNVTYDSRIDGTGNFLITQDGSGGAEFLITTGAVGNSRKFSFSRGATLLMEIQGDGDVNSLTGVFGSISDRNVKTDINLVNAQDVLARVAELPISTWRYKENSDELHMGPMAQDFWAAFGLHEGDKSIALNDLSGVALAAIKGLNLELSKRDEMIQELKSRLERLEAQQADQ